MRIILRPLLVSGMYATEPGTESDVILINSEQSLEEQGIVFWHEMLHLPFGKTCTEAEHHFIEHQAQELAKAFPDVWWAVKRRQVTVGVEGEPVRP